ncbi:ranaspumin-like [Hyperolius riggenbachi]|uniref:ranaspumin-like n=1 Tax=Hyperolius riggenbachi TaxID=752182 RepID=UPI0035A36E79
MKIAVVFLCVSVSFCFGSRRDGFTAIGGHKPGDKSEVPTIPKECLQKLLKVNLPETLEALKDLLCLYKQGEKTGNEELIKEFLEKLHQALIRAGCTVDEILSLEEFLEKVTDKVGEVAKKLVDQILKLVDELELLGTLSGLLCGVLGEPLGNLADILGGLGGGKGASGGLLGGLLG